MQNFLFSVLKRGIGATNREQSLDLVEGSLLSQSTGFGVKGVALIPGGEGSETAGEIVPIFRIFAATHRDLVPRIELWHATHGREDGKSQLELLWGCVGVIEEAGSVVVAEEWYEALRMRVESVESEDVGELRHGCVVQEGFAESEVGWEIEWS